MRSHGGISNIDAKLSEDGWQNYGSLAYTESFYL